MRTRWRRPVGGFTLVELLIVMTIIGILLAFILRAAMEGSQQANIKATQGLIAKLEAGVSDRLDALLEYRAQPLVAHFQMANVNNGTGIPPSAQRAQIIAQFDYLKSQMPDVFLFDPTNTSYPLNFAAPPFPPTGGTGTQYDYVLPLGAGQIPSAGLGIHGATYAAAAGIYKNFGRNPNKLDPLYNDGNGPQLFNGVDDDKDGFIDNWTSGEGANSTALKSFQNNHKHKTARAEALYAFLVEGNAAYGSVFNRDDFTDREVQDTDGDGLPEFVDAWGEPLYFYRWPVAYHSDIQKGFVAPSAGPYANIFVAREQDTMDPNQQLMAPFWWSNSYNTGTILSLTPGSGMQISSSGLAFETYFHPLREPFAAGTANTVNFWDRGSTYFQRRAYFSKFLILSGGPDKEPGVLRLSDFNPPNTSTAQMPLNPTNLLIESQARQIPDLSWPPSANPQDPATGNFLSDSAQDDISNHTQQATGGGTL